MSAHGRGDVREFRLYRRRSPARLAESGWGSGRSVWQSDDAKRDTSVDSIEVTTADAPDHVVDVLELAEGEQVVVRHRRYLVDEVPVQVATSYYPEHLVRGTQIAEADTGDGGVYARLAELGHKPVNFREELRARMPRDSETRLLELAQGTPVIVVVRTAYTAEGRAVEGEDPGEWIPQPRRRPDPDAEGWAILVEMGHGTTGSASSKIAPASSAL